MRVKFWGVRGSIPTPFTTDQLQARLAEALQGAAGVDLSDPAEVQAYIAGLPPALRSLVGGNTTCVEVDTGDATLIVDAGSGMRALGLDLMTREFGLGMGTAHILLTHAHWDHLQGYPFFAPAYVPGNRLIFYAVGHDPREFLDHQQVAPTHFPIPHDAMLAEKEFVTLREGQTLRIGRTEITHKLLVHPGTAHAYRFDDGESIFVFASDGEYPKLDEESLRPYTDFFADADALAFDSQYSLRDVFLSKADWGHSSAIIGVDIAERARVKRLVTVHHDPTHSDEQIHEIGEAASRYARVNGLSSDLDVIVATEGLELHLGRPLGLEVVEDAAGDVWTQAIAGRLDATTGLEASSCVSDFIERAGAHPIILDLNLVAAIDALGIKALLDTLHDHPGADTAFVADRLPVRRALLRSDVDRVAPVLRTRRQALAVLTGPGRWLKDSPDQTGEYILGDMLAVNKLGVVYRATHRKSETPAAVHLVGGRVDHPDRVEFERHAHHWLGLEHPLLLRGLDLIRGEDWAGYVSEWQPGPSYREWLKSGPHLEEMLAYAEALAEALATLHTRGGLHGDLHPENLMHAGGRPRISRSPLYQNRDHPSATAYHAPEQLRNAAPAPTADVYALGVFIYEMLMGVHPFAAETEELMITLKLRSEPQSPRLRWPAIPDRLDEFLMRALAAEPERRFPSAVEALDEFRALLPDARRAVRR